MALFLNIEAEGHARAKAVLERVKDIMGMADWACVLIPHRNTRAQVGEYHVLKSQTGVCGSFRFINNEARDH